MPTIQPNNKQLKDSLNYGRFLEATQYLDGEQEGVINLVQALYKLLGDEAKIGGQLGLVINHALQCVGIDRKDFIRITPQSNPCLIGRLYNDKYQQATEYFPHENPVAPEAEELIYALSNMMENPGWYGGNLETIKRYAVSNILESLDTRSTSN